AADLPTDQGHVVEESVCLRLGEIRLASFSAKAPDSRIPRELIVGPVWATGNAVAIQVVGVGVGQQSSLGDGFQQTEADHLRRNTNGKLGVGVKRAVAGLADFQLRGA